MATKKKPSPKQLAWRKKFGAMAKRRAKEARAAKRNAGTPRKPAAKRSVAKAVSNSRAKKTRNTGRRRNSTPAGIKAIHESFLGRPTNRTDLKPAPAGTPRDVAKLGDLVKLISEIETFNFKTGEAILAANARGDLFIVGDVVVESNTDFGELWQIEYKAVKSHLDNRMVTYHHRFGEEGGKLPRLRTDKDGRFHVVGGDYTTEAEGITN
jgi:hypothetical protein